MILAIDEGTTGVTCLVIDPDGRIRGRAYREISQSYPRPGWVEHDPEEIWTAVCEVSAMAAADAETSLDALDGIGITNQRETLVVWDRETGKPVHPAIVWQDRRSTEQCRRLRDDGHEPLIRDRTGLLLDPYFSATKLAWLFEHQSDLHRRAEAGELAAGTIDSWLVWKLTGGRTHITDPTNASRTLLFNIDDRSWDPALADLFGVPMSLLPEVRSSSEEYAISDPDAFGAAIPIAGIAGDQQAALYGQGAWSSGLAKNTYGTGAFLLHHTGEKRVASSGGLLTTVACGPRGEYAYALEGAIFVAGAAIQWLRDGLGLIQSAAGSVDLARGLASNDGVYFVPAFTGLGAPHWIPEARGTIFGLTRGTRREHLVRAALEAMAYSTLDVAWTTETDSGIEMKELRVDGGAAANDWLMQFQADVLGIPVRRPPMLETTAFGAAGLAGVALGIWKSPDDFLGAREEDRVFAPTAERGNVAELIKGWRRAIHATRSWAEFQP